MDTERTEEREAEGPLGGAEARKRAFVLAVALLVGAAALILLLAGGEGGEEAGGDAAERGPERMVVASPGAAADSARLDGGELRAARATAKRFALAYLARESGRMDAAARRVLRSLGSPELWAELRQAPRATPAWRPPPARFEALSGVTETPFAGVVDVVVAYRVAGRRQYLTVRLSREGGRWRALRHEP